MITPSKQNFFDPKAVDTEATSNPDSETHQGASHPDQFAENCPRLDGTKPEERREAGEISDDDVALLFAEAAQS